ncbi:unnamed protein product [Nesidiocoris tenuis]|uniref:Uncharacterized protein n=1 Tax=Nesidiocoris tenuis TaxID=355587 RepID=A0A6H5GSR5_9HEMI|nr:unnamed protein product [Nesidiocoris tenuis]
MFWSKNFETSASPRKSGKPWEEFLVSDIGMKTFGNNFNIEVTGESCSAAEGCDCDNAHLFGDVCTGKWKWQTPPCANPVTPIGFCFPICAKSKEQRAKSKEQRATFNQSREFLSFSKVPYFLRVLRRTRNNGALRQGNIGVKSPYLNFDSDYVSKPEYILPEGASKQRGRFELAFGQIGASVMIGAGVGGTAGIYNGLKQTTLAGQTGKLRRTQRERRILLLRLPGHDTGGNLVRPARPLSRIPRLLLRSAHQDDIDYQRSANGMLAKAIYERLPCEVSYDLMDFLQPDPNFLDYRYRRGSSIIDTDLMLKISMWSNVMIILIYFVITVVNVKCSRMPKRNVKKTKMSENHYWHPSLIGIDVKNTRLLSEEVPRLATPYSSHKASGYYTNGSTRNRRPSCPPGYAELRDPPGAVHSPPGRTIVPKRGLFSQSETRSSGLDTPIDGSNRRLKRFRVCLNLKVAQ